MRKKGIRGDHGCILGVTWVGHGSRQDAKLGHFYVYWSLLCLFGALESWTLLWLAGHLFDH